MPKMTERSERVSASVEKDFKRILRMEAAKREMSMSELIYRILRNSFDEDDSILDDIGEEIDFNDIDLEELDDMNDLRSESD